MSGVMMTSITWHKKVFLIFLIRCDVTMCMKCSATAISAYLFTKRSTKVFSQSCFRGETIHAIHSRVRARNVADERAWVRGRCDKCSWGKTLFQKCPNNGLVSLASVVAMLVERGCPSSLSVSSWGLGSRLQIADRRPAQHRNSAQAKVTICRV